MVSSVGAGSTVGAKALPRPASAMSDRTFGLVLALPAIISLILVVGIPGVQTLVYSFQRVPLSDDPATFVGTDNYAKVLGDESFVESLVVTLQYTAGYVVLATVLGLLFALLLDQPLRGRGIARALLIIPWATPVIIAGVMWKWLIDPQVGGLNAVLFELGVLEDYKPFLADREWALVFTILAAGWHQASFSALLFLASLQTLPNEIVEAAKVDGATAWQRFRGVVFPWIRPMLLVVVVINVIYGVLQFDTVWVMTQGGPGDATTLLPILLYRQLFIFSDIGAGSALAVMLGVVAVLVSSIALILLGRDNPLEA